MKVVEVLSASDLNPKYLSCVRFYISAWLSLPVRNEIIFIPKVLLIAGSIPDELQAYSEYLMVVDPEDMHSAYASQTSRIIEARNSEADFVMTSDIDMLPLNIDFESHVVNSETLNQNSFFILRDVLEPGQFPICYNLAKPKIWQSLLHQYGPETPTSKILRAILDEFGGKSVYSGLHGGGGWTIDQQALWKLVQRNSMNIHIERFKDCQTDHRRLDRARHRGLFKWIVLPLVFLGFYHDYHVHHPVDENETYIKILMKARNLGNAMRAS